MHSCLDAYSVQARCLRYRWFNTIHRFLFILYEIAQPNTREVHKFHTEVLEVKSHGNL